MIRSFATWSVKNRVTINMIMVLILIAGLFTLWTLRRESFPQFALDYIYITMAYPGAAPAEIEEGICVKIEEAIKGVDGIKKITSTASEGVGTVVAELEPGVRDAREILDEIELEVDRIETFPEEAKDPIIRQVVLHDPVIYVAVYGNAPEPTLRRLAERVRDDLTDTPAITQAELSGARPYEISIELSEARLREFGLTFDEVALAVRRASLDLPGGVIKAPGGEVALRAKGQRYTGREFEQITVKTLPSGARLTVGQVARVVDGFEDVDQRVRFNGQPAVIVNVMKTKEQDLLAIADTVHEYVSAHSHSLPPGINMTSFFDQSVMVRDRISLLMRNGVQGLILVFLCLTLFLEFRLAFWVALGIPISFMGAMWVLGLRNDSINMISLFAFIMVLGMVVDDAIIIGENIYTKYEQGLSPARACIEGTAQVGWPVIMTVVTTIVAFIPLFFVSGIMGRFIAVMPVAIIATLSVSLLEALFILPGHLSGSLEHQQARRTAGPKSRTAAAVRRTLDGFEHWLVVKTYQPILRQALEYRYIGLATALGVFIISVGVVASGRVPFVLFPRPDSNWLIARVSYPFGTPIQTTEAALERLENALVQVDREFAGRVKKKTRPDQGVVNYIFTIVGSIMGQGVERGESGSHAGQVIVELVPTDQRTVGHQEILNRWRELAGEFPGVETLQFTNPVMGPGGNPIEIQLQGDDYETLRRASLDLQSRIAAYPGTFDIHDDFRPGKPELKFKLKDSARMLGLTHADLARQLRQGFYGEEAVRIQRGRDDVKVMVRYSESERHTRGSIETIRVRTPRGDEVPLSTVADIEPGRGYSTINRTDRRRTITVISDVDEERANAREITEDLKSSFFPELHRRYPGLTITFGGQEKESSEAVGSLMRGFVLALLAIYGLLATQFRSYIQPIIVMVAIPFGIIGAVAGHLLFGEPLTLMSLFGIVALSGIVVNDSLVLISFINERRAAGAGIKQAAWESGIARFRAVILTSLTTFAGLFPILMETSFQAQFLKAMVISITFGILFATALTLLLVPGLYIILHDILHLVQPGLGQVPEEAALD
ncbi:MAG: efflux RND transporter permease subunit [Candidatus Sumerlaeia bacterium]